MMDIQDWRSVRSGMIRSLTFALLLAISTSASATVSFFGPRGGPETGGTRVKISGDNLIPASAACSAGQSCSGVTVYFGTVAGTVVQASPNLIVATSPAHVAGTTEVRVHAPGVADTVIPGAFRFDWDTADFLPENYIRYLVPTTLRDAAGANGSLWTSVLTVFLKGPGTAVVGPFSPAGVNGSIPGNVPTELRFKSDAGKDGAFFYVPRVLEHSVATDLHIMDLSLTADTLGTALPVVPEDEFRSTQNLLAVPVDARYRVLLRIYDLDRLSLGVNVAVYGPSSQTPIDTIHVNLAGFETIAEQPQPLNPSYAALDPITDKVRASGQSRVRIEITAEGKNDLPPATTIWAMATVTNNATQQVTAIVPSR